MSIYDDPRVADQMAEIHLAEETAAIARVEDVRIQLALAGLLALVEQETRR